MEVASDFVATLNPAQLDFLVSLLSIVQAGLIAHQSDDNIIDRLMAFAKVYQFPREKQHIRRVGRVYQPRKFEINQSYQVYASSPG